MILIYRDYGVVIWEGVCGVDGSHIRRVDTTVGESLYDLWPYCDLTVTMV